MSKLALLVTLVLELLLAFTRYLACRMKRKDKYGDETKPSCKWEQIPFSFKLNWYGCLGQNADKGVKPPKVTDPHSRDV